MTTTRRHLIAAATAALSFPAVLAQGSYPNRPIKIVVSVAPGAAGDALMRKIGEPLGKLLGQPIVIENRPGAQGGIAARLVAKAPADGYTLLVGGNSSHAANAHMLKNPGYDPIKDFTPIAQLTANPQLLVVRSQLPVNNLREFIQYAKERPGKLSYGTGNSGSLVSAQLLKTQAGIEAVGINYAGMAQAATDLLGGRLDFVMLDPVVAGPFVQAGQMRILGITSRQRLSALPDVAPLAEVGLPQYDFIGWIAMFGPANMPADATARLQQAFSTVMASPEIQSFAAEVGMIAQSQPPERFPVFLREQIQAWGRWIKEAGVQPL